MDPIVLSLPDSKCLDIFVLNHQTHPIISAGPASNVPCAAMLGPERFHTLMLNPNIFVHDVTMVFLVYVVAKVVRM